MTEGCDAAIFVADIPSPEVLATVLFCARDKGPLVGGHDGMASQVRRRRKKEGRPDFARRGKSEARGRSREKITNGMTIDVFPILSFQLKLLRLTISSFTVACALANWSHYYVKERRGARWGWFVVRNILMSVDSINLNPFAAVLTVLTAPETHT